MSSVNNFYSLYMDSIKPKEYYLNQLDFAKEALYNKLNFQKVHLNGVVGNYKYNEKDFFINKGPCGSSYQAFRKSDGSSVIVKKSILNLSFMNENQFSLLKDEIQRLYSLNHKNIINMIDFILSEVGYYQNKIPYNDLYIVSEYGYIDLKNFIFIKYESGMPRTLYKNFLYQILEGLKYCVEKNVVHGNLKPKNVILFENFEYDKLTENDQSKNSRYILKLTDFKIDRVTESHSDFSSIVYKSPEVILKNNLNSYRNYSMDIWSAACIFYEMVTGVPLFNEKYLNRFDLFKHVMEVTNTTDEKFKNMFASEYWTLKEVFNNETKPRKNPLILLENKFVPCEMNLFKKMLCFNPLTRIHAFSALKTDYFRSQSLEIDDDVIDTINNNINTTNNNISNNINNTNSDKSNNNNSSGSTNNSSNNNKSYNNNDNINMSMNINTKYNNINSNNLNNNNSFKSNIASIEINNNNMKNSINQNEINDIQSRKSNDEKIKNIKNSFKMPYLKSDLKPFKPLKVNISYPKTEVEGYDFNSHIRNLVVEALPITFKKDEIKEEGKSSWHTECSGEKIFKSNESYRDNNLYYNDMDSDLSENSNASDVDMDSDSSYNNNNSPETYDDNKTMVNDSPLNNEINQLNEEKSLKDSSSSLSENEEESTNQSENNSLDDSENLKQYLNHEFFENTMNSSIYNNIINQLSDNFEESKKPNNEEDCNTIESIQLNFDLFNMIYNSLNSKNNSKLIVSNTENSNNNEVFPSINDNNNYNNNDDKNNDIFNDLNSLINTNEINNILKHNYSNINEINQDNYSLEENKISQIDEKSIINKFRNYCKSGNKKTTSHEVAVTDDSKNSNNSVEALNNDLIQDHDLNENLNYKNFINKNEQFATINFNGININNEIKIENLPLTNEFCTNNEPISVEDSIPQDEPKEFCNILMNTNNLCENEMISHKRKLYIDQEGHLSNNLEENNNTSSMKRKRNNKNIFQNEY